MSVTSRPGRRTKDANPKIVRRAAMDAEMDIRRKKLDAKKRTDELEQIRNNRQRLTKARQMGKLDKNKMEEINRSNTRKRDLSPHSMENQDYIHPDESHRKSTKKSYRADDGNDIKDSSKRKRTRDEQHTYMNERTSRQCRTAEVALKPRKAVMDREAKEGQKVKLVRSESIFEDSKANIDHKNTLARQNDSDSDALENTLPDLRQRLVDRKKRRKQEKQHSGQHLGRQDIKQAAVEDKNAISKRLLQNESRFRMEDEYLVSDRLIVDKNGKNILPKNLRIQATIRNDRHIEERKRKTERVERSPEAQSQEYSESRKRHDRPTDKEDETGRLVAYKRRKIEETNKDNLEEDEADDELTEMRKNAIESMRRRREADATSQYKQEENVERDYKKTNKHHRSLKAQKRSEDVLTKRNSQIETLKQVILEIQDGDSEDITSDSSEGGGTDGSKGSGPENDNDASDGHGLKDSKDEESEISLTSTDEDELSNTRITVHTTNKNQYHMEYDSMANKDDKLERDNKDTKFIVTLDGINSAYFKKEDKEASKGGLKLKKQEPTSQTVYIKTNRALPNMNDSDAAFEQEKPVISLPTSKIKHGDSYDPKTATGTIHIHAGNPAVEKPKAMVAPLRSNSFNSSYSVKPSSPSSKANYFQTSSAPSVTGTPTKDGLLSSTKESAKEESSHQQKRKRILPPELSPNRNSPHSVLAGANKYLKRTPNEISTPSPGIM